MMVPSMNLVAILALACVFSAMFALGTRLQPRRLAQELPEFGLIARALGVALIAVPTLALVYASLLEIRPVLLAGFLLIGISPGAPMALLRAHEHGGRASFSVVLQVAIAVFAIFAVPAWILVLDFMYGADAAVDITGIAFEVFRAQLLPLVCGAVCANFFPSLAARLAGPLLRLSAILLLVVLALVLWNLGPRLPELGWAPYVASALLSASGLALGHFAGGPAVDTRTAAAILCTMRNPGIALLILSANRFPAIATVMVLAHVLVTALLLVVYLAIRRRTVGLPSDHNR
ncbi:hypothetical protein AYO41_03875 [Verrucomicrobia bacterium SCGC AG-212-E04]|nr:hypothetical protein AYO41_03875 [Verrucomicrobia bacterium SCGC AG-212-E04]